MSVKVTVTLQDDGRLLVETSADKIVAVGLIEAAKHFILAKQPEQAPRVQPVAVIPNLRPVGG